MPGSTAPLRRCGSRASYLPCAAQVVRSGVRAALRIPACSVEPSTGSLRGQVIRVSTLSSWLSSSGSAAQLLRKLTRSTGTGIEQIMGVCGVMVVTVPGRVTPLRTHKVTGHVRHSVVHGCSQRFVRCPSLPGDLTNPAPARRPIPGLLSELSLSSTPPRLHSCWRLRPVRPRGLAHATFLAPFRQHQRLPRPPVRPLPENTAESDSAMSKEAHPRTKG